MFLLIDRIFAAKCEDYFFVICHKDFKYEFIPQSKNWSEAQQYCRNEYDDLASFKEESDLVQAEAIEDFPVWTGLYKDGKKLTQSQPLYSVQ